MEKFGLKAQDDKAIRQLTQKISSYLGVEYITKTQQISKKDENGSKDSITNILKKKSLRFLRCASLFFHFYTDIPLPEGKPGKENNLQTSYEALTSYLGLPNTFSKLIETPGVAEVIESMLSVSNNVTNSFIPLEIPVRRRSLIELPENYLSLLSKADQFKCPNSVSKESKSPALCLACGTIVCSQSPCCELQLDRVKAGGCTVHARRCGGDNGIFLRLRKCQIILLSDVKRGVLLPAPYVDEYGECDEGLKRGNPLKLDKAMYEELNKVWLNNDIPDKISRHFDTEVVTISARWYEL
jgi:E3 ubiquitin-protein ligase UBR2